MGKANENNKGMRLDSQKPKVSGMPKNLRFFEQGENRRFFSSKGGGGWFIILSIIGILVGLWMLSQGFGGKGLSSGTTIIIGFFVVVKEFMDIFFSG